MLAHLSIINAAMQLLRLVAKRIQPHIGSAVSMSAPSNLSPPTGHLANEKVKLPNVLLGVLESVDLI